MSVVAEIAAQAERWGEVAGNAFEEAYKNTVSAEMVRTPDENDAIVRAGTETFLEVGEALRQIHAGKQYRELGFRTFEAYCKEAAGISRVHGYRLMKNVTSGLQNSQLLTASDENEWYTPARYIEAARRVLGEIDLDPASSTEANATVLATAFYTRADNGFTHDWAGRVWLNPPYGGDAGSFVNRLVDEFSGGNVTAAIALVNAHCTDTDWFQPLFDRSLCFTNHRIDFDSAGRDKCNSSTHGSVFAYFGDDDAVFAREFAEFGPIVRRF